MTFTSDAEGAEHRAAGSVHPMLEGSRSTPRRPFFGWRSAVAMTTGGLLTGLAAAAALAVGARGDDGAVLEPVARGELAAASQSLLPVQAAALVGEAESCRAPLAALTIRGTATGRGVVRIRSGGYLSPNLQLGPKPDRIAVPYPAPFLAGRGQITIESAAEGADVFLRPGRHIEPGRRATVIDVRWDSKAPC